MFRHDRVYRAIAFSAPDLSELASVRSLLPKKCLSIAEASRSRARFTVEHYYYYSPSAFTRNIDVLEKAKARWNGKNQYRYNIYFLGIHHQRQFITFLAVPFWSMALEVYSNVRNSTRGRNFVFRKVALERILSVDHESQELAAIMKISRVAYNIEGDAASDSLEFFGKDLAHCNTLETLKTHLEGPSLVPQSVRLAYKKSFDERFSLEADKFGHFRFRVSKSGRTFPCLTDVFIALSSAGLLDETTAFPYLGLGEPEDELGESE
jgi:hypothetical protein